MSTKITFDFFQNPSKNKVKQIQIFDFTLSINLFECQIYEIDLNNYNIASYKIVEIFYTFENDIKKNFLIPIYQNINNYFYSGSEISNNSVQLIFYNNKSNPLLIEECEIVYKDKSFLPKNNFPSVKNRKCINLININLEYLKLDNKLITKDGDFIISIMNKEKMRKVIGQYELVLDKEISKNINKKETIKQIEELLETIEKNFFSKEDLYDKKIFFNKIDFNKEQLIKYNEIRSRANEIIIAVYKNYFDSYKENLDNDDKKIYELLSDLLLIGISPNTYPYLYFKQFYYSVIQYQNFVKSIPFYVNDINNLKLKITVAKTIYDYFNSDTENRNFSFNFEFLDINKDFLYSKAKQKCIEFIENLDEDSVVFPFFLSINSGSSYNLLKSDYLAAKTSMISINDIKNHLFNSLPIYSIRGQISSNYRAVTYLETKIIIFNEEKMFYKDYDNLFDEDLKKFTISNIIKHECFGHIKFQLYEAEQKGGFPSTPIQFYDIKKKELVNLKIKDRYNNNFIGEAGASFEYFEAQGDINILNFIKNPFGNCKELFSKSSFKTKKDYEDFIKIIKNKIKATEGKSKNFLLNLDTKFDNINIEGYSMINALNSRSIKY